MRFSRRLGLILVTTMYVQALLKGRMGLTKVLSGRALFSDITAQGVVTDQHLITSSNNPHLRLIDTLVSGTRRQKEKVFEEQGRELVVVEGVRAVLNMAQSSRRTDIHYLFHSPVSSSSLFDTDNEHNNDSRRVLFDLLYSSHQSAEWKKKLYRIDSKLLQSVSDTVHSQGVLAIVSKPNYTVESLFLDTQETLSTPTSQSSRMSKVFLLLDRLADPGNVGTIIRSAFAMGFGGILAVDCCDLFSAKVTRACMAANLDIPIIQTKSAEIAAVVSSLVAKDQSQRCHLIVCDASTNSSVDYHSIDYRSLALASDDVNSSHSQVPLILMIGSEAHGVHKTLHDIPVQTHSQISAQRVLIPMHRHQAESLNAAVAAGIVMAEISHQLSCR